MEYLLSIYTNENGAEPKSGTPEHEAMMADYFAFTNEVREAGVFVGGNALQDTSTATTVAVRGGGSVTADATEPSQ